MGRRRALGPRRLADTCARRAFHPRPLVLVCSMPRPRNRGPVSTIAAPKREIPAGPRFAGLLAPDWRTTPRACGIRVRFRPGVATFRDEGISGNANSLLLNLFETATV